MCEQWYECLIAMKKSHDSKKRSEKNRLQLVMSHLIKISILKNYLNQKN